MRSRYDSSVAEIQNRTQINLVYVNSPARYPATLFVRMSMDADTGFAWNRVMAVSLISILPSLIVFFLAQSQFMDGVTAGAVKG